MEGKYLQKVRCIAEVHHSAVFHITLYNPKFIKYFHLVILHMQQWRPVAITIVRLCDPFATAGDYKHQRIAA